MSTNHYFYKGEMEKTSLGFRGCWLWDIKQIQMLKMTGTYQICQFQNVLLGTEHEGPSSQKTRCLTAGQFTSIKFLFYRFYLFTYLFRSGFAWGSPRADEVGPRGSFQCNTHIPTCNLILLSHLLAGSCESETRSQPSGSLGYGSHVSLICYSFFFFKWFLHCLLGLLPPQSAPSELSMSRAAMKYIKTT